ncbi:T9SS type A sorting domain-containing protein [candidate division TA06 bacterium]|uniref:T9SS type A sorting domain-containing protein n=1 Tax=candidate division TA06 bacterium TaxID=2250710 RepID=A0A523UYM2_UNCT6|nr:MAG: T9SS type A sorting domain-containing protein [candidate division TA06 bacterium]
MRLIFVISLIVCVSAGAVYSNEPCTDTIYAKVIDDTVKVFHDGAFYNCCAVIDFEFEIGDTFIDIVETETFPKGPCYCMCCLDLSLSISNVPPGVYWVYVWNEDKSVLYGKTRVVVGGLGSGPVGICNVWQSDCYTLAPGTVHDGLPCTFTLDEPAPNPTMGHTCLFYQLDKPGTVSIKVYDSSGRMASLVAERDQPAGRYSLQWDGRRGDGERLPSGIYFVRLSLGSNVAVRKLLIAR